MGKFFVDYRKILATSNAPLYGTLFSVDVHWGRKTLFDGPTAGLLGSTLIGILGLDTGMPKAVPKTTTPKEPALPRKKACKQCTKAKVRCGLERPSCRRCQSRDLPCKYFTPGPLPGNVATPTNLRIDATEPEQLTTPVGYPSTPIGLADDIFCSPHPAQNLTPTLRRQNPEFRSAGGQHRNTTDFTTIDLISVTDSTLIRDRWLQSFLPTPGQRAKVLPPRTVQLLSCVFRSYSRTLLRPGCFPPFIHPLQVVEGELPQALANCFSLVRMWVGREQGSDVMVVETVRSEMERLFDEHKTYFQLDILAAFQAYLIYATTAFFLPISNPSVKMPLVDHTTMSNLQEFAYQLSLSGLICTAEATHSRPSWESWVVASAKRRALYAMYLFDNVFNALAQVPTYIAEELANLPVPASKSLWEATKREVWEREYYRHLAAWEGGELRISELWFTPEKDSSERRERVDRWVGSVDEFGMMLFAVCAHIHGC